MKTKTVAKYTYDGLEFPVELIQVVMVYIDGEWQPKIDVKKVATLAMKELSLQKERYTGNQVKFIRTYFSMALREFARVAVHESHTAVSKWEKFADNPTNMDKNIEMMLRLYICERLYMNTIKQKNEFYKRYLKLKQIFLSDSQAGVA